MSLNTGQDFDGALRELMGVIGTEIEWDLSDMVPAVSAWLDDRDEGRELASAEHVVRHAPTNLNPAGTRWYERAPVISRLITIYDHLRDYPGAVRQR